MYIQRLAYLELQNLSLHTETQSSHLLSLLHLIYLVNFLGYHTRYRTHKPNVFTSYHHTVPRQTGLIYHNWMLHCLQLYTELQRQTYGKVSKLNLVVLFLYNSLIQNVFIREYVPQVFHCRSRTITLEGEQYIRTSVCVQ